MRKLAILAGAALGLLATPALATTILPEGQGVDSGDTAWIIAAALLALLTTIPGLALFYGGRLGARSLAPVALQCAAIMAIASLAWVGAGFTIAFGWATVSGWTGSGKGLMLADLGSVRPGTPIPESAFALFHMSLAIFAPALMVGAWTGRARLGWVLGFAALWVLVVYAPIAHWIWSGGWLARQFGTIDYAGGLVVHTSAGVSALVVALLLGPRHGFPEAPRQPHAPALAMVGAALVWIGWLAISGGAALGANDNAASAMLATHIAACAGALTWLLVENVTLGKPSATGWGIGAMAGLAAIAPAAVFVAPGAAALFGGLAALLSYGTIRQLKHRWRVDDAFDVFAVNGVGGMLGTILLAVFLSPALGGTGYFDEATMASQLVAQAAAVGAVVVWSAVGSAVLALMVSFALPMRVSAADEDAGLD